MKADILQFNYVNNGRMNNTKETSKMNSSSISSPTFQSNDINRNISSAAANSIRAQSLVSPRLTFTGNSSSFTEKDVNIAVTCVGLGNIKGNKREVNDHRCTMQAEKGLYWYENFNRPYLMRNKNGDERLNGESTIIVFPLHPRSEGYRVSDNMSMVLNGNIPSDIINDLVVYMAKVGILMKEPVGKVHYCVNSLSPNNFMANPKIKTLIAGFIDERLNQAKSIQETTSVQQTKNKYGLNLDSINIANLDCTQNKDNKRIVKDYIRNFLKNDRKFTVLYDKYTDGSESKDVTVILIPSKKIKDDFITVTLDAIVPEVECKNLINHHK